MSIIYLEVGVSNVWLLFLVMRKLIAQVVGLTSFGTHDLNRLCVKTSQLDALTVISSRTLLAKTTAVTGLSFKLKLHLTA